MSTVLITGASGFIGRALAASMSEDHEVICLGRRNPQIEAVRYLRGDFTHFEDLRQLDRHHVDAVVHLAAVTGGCLERDGLLVNVEGSRCLMRYLIDNGCRKFVMASSIAAVGIQRVDFRPDTVPIADEHPCYDRDGYGFSKYMMEEMTRYHFRQHPDIDVMNLRLSSVIPDDEKAAPRGIRALGQWALGGITVMVLPDAVRAFAMAAQSPFVPGLRIMNATASRAWASVPTADILSEWWGNDVDLSWFESPSRRNASVYDVEKIRMELGFTAGRTLEILEERG